MNQNEINEGNRLIAEFMQFNKEANSHYHCLFDGINQILPPQYMKFATSWDWLMPVVKRISSLGSEEADIYDSDYYHSIEDALPSCNIEDVFKVVIEFIKWYDTERKGLINFTVCFERRENHKYFTKVKAKSVEEALKLFEENPGKYEWHDEDDPIEGIAITHINIE